MEEITELEKKVLRLRQEDGYTVEETKKELNITEKQYRNIKKHLEELDLYSNDEIKRAKIRRNARERKKRQREHPETKLSEMDEFYRKQCIEFISVNFLNYDATGIFNPVLVTKLKELRKSYSYKVIYFTAQAQYENIKSALNYRNINTSNGKISYLIAIIRNNLSATWKKIQYQDKVNNAEFKNFNLDKFYDRMEKPVPNVHTSKTDMSEWLD